MYNVNAAGQACASIGTHDDKAYLVEAYTLTMNEYRRRRFAMDGGQGEVTYRGIPDGTYIKSICPSGGHGRGHRLAGYKTGPRLRKRTVNRVVDD